MDGPKQMWNIFCALVRPSTLASPPVKKMSLFSSNLNVQNSVVMFTFSDFDRKYPFWVNLVQKIEIFSLF